MESGKGDNRLGRRAVHDVVALATSTQYGNYFFQIADCNIKHNDHLYIILIYKFLVVYKQDFGNYPIV